MFDDSSVPRLVAAYIVKVLKDSCLDVILFLSLLERNGFDFAPDFSFVYLLLAEFTINHLPFLVLYPSLVVTCGNGD